MRIPSRSRGPLAVCLFTLVWCLGIAQSVLGQTMSFSVYTDANMSYPTNATVTAYTSVQDHSSGCAHTGYYTSVTLRSPSGRQATGNTSGLSVQASLSWGNEEGNWTATTNCTYSCSCIYGGTAAFGGYFSFPISRYEARYYYVGPQDGKYFYTADSCAHDCQLGSVLRDSYQGIYLWDRGVHIHLGPIGLCKRNYQGSAQRGLCKPG